MNCANKVEAGWKSVEIGQRASNHILTKLDDSIRRVKRFAIRHHCNHQRFVADRATVAFAVIYSFPPTKAIVISTEAAHVFASNEAENSASTSTG
jgi:hypothetical protein